MCKGWTLRTCSQYAGGIKTHQLPVIFSITFLCLKKIQTGRSFDNYDSILFKMLSSVHTKTKKAFVSNFLSLRSFIEKLPLLDGLGWTVGYSPALLGFSGVVWTVPHNITKERTSILSVVHQILWLRQSCTALPPVVIMSLVERLHRI